MDRVSTPHTGCLRSHFAWADTRWHFYDYPEYLVLVLRFNAQAAVIIGHMAIHGK